LALFAPSYGGIRQRQIEADPAAEGDTGAKLAGVAGGAAMAAVERLGGGERLASILLREGREGLAKEVGKAGARQVAATGALRNLVTGPVGRTALRAGLTEAAEEAVQSPIEQLASFQNPLTPESLQETAFQTVMGALGGGGIGTAFGVLTPRGKDTVDPSDVSDKDITNVVDGALAASSLRQQAPTEQPDLFEVVPDEELSPQGDLFEQGPPRVGLIPTRLPAVPEQIQPAQEPPLQQPQTPTEQPSLFEVVPAEEASAQGDLFPQGTQQVPLVPTRPATSASAVPAVDLSGVKGLPKAVRGALEQAETPEALEEAVARQLYEKRKAGSSAQYVTSPTGALQSLYRTLTGRDSVPTQEELAERFEPPAQPQAPTEQPSLFEAVPAEELPAQGDLFPQGPQQVPLVPTTPTAGQAPAPQRGQRTARQRRGAQQEQQAPAPQDVGQVQQASPAPQEVQPPPQVAEQPATPPRTPSRAVLSAPPAVRQRAARRRAQPAPVEAPQAATAPQPAATQQPQQPAEPAQPTQPSRLSPVEEREKAEDVARLRRLEERADRATMRLVEDDGTMSESLRRRFESEIEAFEAEQAAFDSKYSVKPSRGRKNPAGTHTAESVVEDIRARVGKAVGALLGKRFVVVQTIQDVRNDMRRRGSFNADAVQDGAKGLYDPSTGVSYIVAENMAASDSAWGVLLHEMGVHYGLRRFLGDSGYAGVLRDVRRFIAAGDPAFLAAARRVNVEESLGLDPTSPDFVERISEQLAANERLAEEVLGYFAENPNNHNRSLWRRTVVAVKKFLRRAGLDIPLSTQDVMDVVHASIRSAANEQVPGSAQAMERDAREALEDFGFRAVPNADGTVDIVNAVGRVVADEDIPTQLQVAAALVKYPGLSDQLMGDITNTGPLYSRSTARGSLSDSSATALQDLGQAANAARVVKARALSLLTGGTGSAPSTRALRMIASWADRNTLVQLFDRQFGGALQRNAQTYATQEVTAARFGQLFTTTYQRLERLEREDRTTYNAISKLMQATEMNMDPRKTWEQHTHLHKERTEDQVALKGKLSNFRQAWGLLNPAQRKIYEDLVAMNETTYFADMAMTMRTMVAGQPVDAATQAVFAADASEAFRNDPNTHENVDAARAYWKGVLDRYTTALSAYTTAERDKLPEREPTTPEDQAAITAALKGVTDKAQRKRIRRMLTAGRQTGLSAEQRAKIAQLNMLNAQLEMVGRNLEAIKQSPYFHLGRFGNFAVGLTVRKDAEGNPDLAAMKEVVGRLSDAFPTISMRADADSPAVYARFESAESAQTFVDAVAKLRDEGLLDTTGESGGFFAEVKSSVLQRAVGPAWLENVIAKIAEDTDDPDATNRFIADLRSIYLESLPDRSTARVMAHRKGRQGYSTDMVRSYAHRMLVAANHIAGLAAAPVRQDTFRDMQQAIVAKQAGESVDVDELDRMRVIVDEFKQRDLESAEPTPQSPMLSILRAVSHVFFLSLSPSYVLLNTMQVPIMGVPELAKRFGTKKSMAAVMAALPDAMKVVRAAISDGHKAGGVVGAAEMVITSDVLANAELSDARVKYLVEMMGTGKLDIGTQAREMGRLAAGEATGQRAARLNNGLKVLTSFTLGSEILARVTMALAARDLHGEDGATAYAARVLDNSMLNYNAYAIGRATGAKGVFKGLTPVALQFHQYPLQALGRLVTETYNAFSRSEGVTDTERSEAKQFLKSHVAALVVLTGTMGLPFMTVAARLSDMLCEMFSDQPCDSKASLRNFTHDVFGADIEPIVSRGILRVIGGDLSSRAGEADLLPFSRFLADRRTLDEKLRDPILSISGATGGMLSNIVAGAQKIADGDWLGGAQSMLPAALKGPAKAYSLTTRGFTDNSGVTLPMEPGAMDVLVQFLGIQPGKEADFMQASRAQRQRTSILSRELSVIRKNIVKAIEQQDREKLREWGRKAAEFQQANPTVDIMQGVTSSLRQRQRMSALSTVGILPGANVRDIGIQERTRFFQPGAQ